MSELLQPFVHVQNTSVPKTWHGLPIRQYVETERRYIVYQDHKRYAAFLIPCLVTDHVVMLANFTQRAYAGTLIDCITVKTSDGWMKSVPFKLTDACINVHMQDACVKYVMHPVEQFVYSESSEFDRTTRMQVLANYFKAKAAT